MNEFQPNNGNMYSFGSLKSRIRPLDLFFFRGGGKTLDNMIELAKNFCLEVGHFTNVALVVTKDILDDDRLEENTFYLLESTMNIEQALDVMNKTITTGVILRKLEDVLLARQDKPIAWCKLKNNPMYDRKDDHFYSLWLRKIMIRKRFSSIFQTMHGRRFDTNVINLLGLYFPALREFRDTRDELYQSLYSVLGFFGRVDPQNNVAGWQFSSELVANIYKELDVLPHVDPRNVTVNDLFGSTEDKIDNILDLPKFIIRG